MYDHYIAFDWAQRVVAVARMTKTRGQIHSFECAPNVKEIQGYLASLKGSKMLVIEESTTSQWLYCEFKDHVDELIICDPRRNRFLLEGAKNDLIDAAKLVRLARGGLLKPVFHTSDDFIYLRRLVSGYEDLVKSGVRLKNQRAALFRANGKSKEAESLERDDDAFVLEGLDRAIGTYEAEKKRYEDEFKRLRKKHPMIANLYSIPGIGEINAVRIAAIVVDPARFPSKNKFLSYCGLVKLDKVSGGKTYGRKRPQFNRALKCAFKMAALSTIGKQKPNHFSSYHKHLIRDKKYAEFNARHAVARRVAIVALGVMKSQRKLDKKKLVIIK